MTVESVASFLCKIFKSGTTTISTSAETFRSTDVVKYGNTHKHKTAKEN